MNLPQSKTALLKIPPELVEQVIDCLALHLSALRACSLTCRIWRPRAQYHLLSSIYIVNADQILAMASFAHKHPVRAAAIHRARINVSALCGDAILQLRPFANATALTLSTGATRTRLPLRLEPLPAIFPHISSLTISNCAFSTQATPALMCAISRFPALHTLELARGTSLGGFGGYFATDPATPPGATPLPLATLSLSGSCRELCAALAQRGWRDLAVLRRLELDITGYANQHIRQLVVRALPALQDLVLRGDHFQHFEDVNHHFEQGSVRPGTGLKTVRFVVGDRDLKPTRLIPLLDLARALANPECTAVTFAIIASDMPPSHMWSFGWEAVVDNLEHIPSPGASFALVIHRHIFVAHREAITEVARKLNALGVVLRKRA